MKGHFKRLLLAFGVVAALMVLPFGLTLFFVWLDMGPAEQERLAELAARWVPIGTALTLLALGVAFGVLKRFFAHDFIQALAALVEQVDALRSLNAPELRLKPFGAEEVRRVAEAINRVLEDRTKLLSEIEARVQSAQASLAAERNRLAALMAQLEEAVLVCNRDARVLLYNEAARRLAERAVPEKAAALGALGLGRTLVSWIEPALLRFAFEEIDVGLTRGNPSPEARFAFITPTHLVVRARIAPILEKEQIVGYLVLLQDATELLQQEAMRNRLLFELTEANRASIANIAMAAEALSAAAASDEALARRFLAAIIAETNSMRDRLSYLNQKAEQLITSRTLHEPVALSVFLTLVVHFVQERLSLNLDLDAEPSSGGAHLWVRVDLFAWLHLLGSLIERLADEYDVERVLLRAAAEDAWVHIDLVWQGGAISSEIITSWELESITLAGQRYPFTVRDVLERHDAAMWFERNRARHEVWLRFALPRLAHDERFLQPQQQESKDKPLQERPLSFDFDLFAWGERAAALDDEPLTALIYTVFDTETTGLHPSEGDEIIQIGAVRIVNGRVLYKEAFEQLIDPKRPLSPASVAIHGITPEMLVGQPTAEVVLPLFHRYAQGSVLVGHNAAFDMRFLELKEAALGLRFDQPVLDTLLLAYFLFPNQTSNRLEALAERLGIPVVGRHTALGDALVTAEIFLAMLPLLAERGIVTLRDARQAAQKTYLAKLRY